MAIPWSQSTGWQPPQIRPCKSQSTSTKISVLSGIVDGPLNLEPSCTVFHYAQTLFEGMKAYRDETGKVTLFRPDMNMKRMNRSAARIALPVRLGDCAVATAHKQNPLQTFDGDALLDCIKTLIRLDAHWIPQEVGHSLYIRPTLSTSM